MKAATIPEAFHRPSNAAVVPDAFAAFYRETLQYSFGSRIRALDVAHLYAAWAAPRREPSISARTLKRAMHGFGHQHFHSNRRYFADVALRQSTNEAQPLNATVSDDARVP